jgi:hypothetical protein
MPLPEKGRFIEPMLLLRTDALPNDAAAMAMRKGELSA